MRPMVAPPARRNIRLQSYAWMFLVFAALIVPAHLWLVRLPYYWDEAGQFVPAALDLLHDGAWIPHSTEPNIHPPALSAYLAAVWRVAGFTPETTRFAMLFLAVAAALAAFLLAIELTRDTKGTPAFLAVALLAISPLFFAQSVLAQLDLPAMLFATVALLLFLQQHMRAAAAACVALVLFKETGAIVPLVLGAWLVREKRWRDALWFAAPLVLLAGWVVVLARHTGSWAGNSEFVRYNVWTPLQPARLLMTLLRRFYFLAIANFHWIGSAAVVLAWRAGGFRSRPWRIAGLLVAAHVLLFTVLGGAVLNRYLLPIMPIVFAAMAAAIAWLPKPWRIGTTAALVLGLLASNWINPPYAFPFEENLAFADFVRLHADAADYVAHWYPGAEVRTIWPMSDELIRPELGYVPRPIKVRTLPDLSAETLGSLDWDKTEVVLVFSRAWESDWSVMKRLPVLNFWERVYNVAPNATPDEARSRIPFPAEASFARRGQWVEVYANPRLRKTFGTR
jgi:hypothetical protein